MELKMETSSAYLLADWMVTQKVPLMESCLVHLSELCLVMRTVMQMEMSLVCLSAERTAKLKVTMLDCPMVMSLVCSLAESMAIRKDLQMAHMRP
eukprot:scaffold39846_cov144-Skeletonema_dohrnii-CCMP3373.AAC.2